MTVQPEEVKTLQILENHSDELFVLGTKLKAEEKALAAENRRHLDYINSIIKALIKLGLLVLGAIALDKLEFTDRQILVVVVCVLFVCLIEFAAELTTYSRAVKRGRFRAKQGSSMNNRTKLQIMIDTVNHKNLRTTEQKNIRLRSLETEGLQYFEAWKQGNAEGLTEAAKRGHPVAILCLVCENLDAVLQNGELIGKGDTSSKSSVLQYCMDGEKRFESQRLYVPYRGLYHAADMEFLALWMKEYDGSKRKPWYVDGIHDAEQQKLRDIMENHSLSPVLEAAVNRYVREHRAI